MRTLKRLILAAGAIVYFTASSDYILGQGGTPYRPDILSVEGSRMRTYYEVDGQLLSLFSVSGRGRLSKPMHGFGRVSIYHIFLLYPEDLTAAVAWGGKGEGVVWAHFVRWLIQAGPAGDYGAREWRDLELKFDGVEMSLIIGTEAFSLSAGNIFIVRLREDWFPMVTQIPARFTNPDEGGQVLKFMKSLSKTGERIPELELFR